MVFRYKTNLLRPKQIKILKEHKYSSTGQSILEHAMQKVWNRQIDYIPLTVAPNLLTLVGLAANVFTSLIIIAFSPDAARGYVPPWASLLCAFGLFVYQSLDALDGKQARRTQSSSPLGELFDHGCDSLSAVFALISVCVCTRMGTSPALMVVMGVITLFVFYTAHWQTYVSGRLLFTSLNVTEAQLAIMVVLVASGLAGTQVWDDVPWLKTAILFITIFGSAYIAYSYIVIVFTGGAGKNKSTIADTSVLSPVFPFGLMAFAAIAIFNKSLLHTPVKDQYFKQNICLYILLFGFVMSKLTDNLVIAHMTRSELPMVDSIFLGPALMALNQYYNDILSERVILWLAFAYTLFDLFHYLCTICVEISSALKIPIFTLPIHSIAAVRSLSQSNNNASNIATSASKPSIAITNGTSTTTPSYGNNNRSKHH